MAAGSCLIGAGDKRCPTSLYKGQLLGDHGEPMSWVSLGCLSQWPRHLAARVILGRCLQANCLFLGAMPHVCKAGAKFPFFEL